MFQTNYQYINRETKATYVWMKYQTLFKDNILDVGADQGFLKQHLPVNTKYVSIGLGSTAIDIEIDLEKEKIPFDNGSFECVLCLDVLEHLDNLHKVFYELCRVTKNYVIISLPNPYLAFLNMLLKGQYKQDQPMKFYGLPNDKPIDRHKWFFSSREAENFLRHQAKINNMKVVQIDFDGIFDLGFIKRYMLQKLVHPSNDFNLILKGTCWAVLQKNTK
ncbi:MAG TPA: methyltransferase domain-containing protein [Selenomonadales bacterium]|nr:methyltransferase domain-containing protein [Selenomonadales bacterium]